MSLTTARSKRPQANRHKVRMCPWSLEGVVPPHRGHLSQDIVDTQATKTMMFQDIVDTLMMGYEQSPPHHHRH